MFGLLFVLIFGFHGYLWNFKQRVYKKVRSWASSFECGFLSQGVSENYFRCSYFLLLVFFVLFDLEVSLLLKLPFQGVLFKNFGFYRFFIICLCVGYVLEVVRGYVR